MSSATVTAGVTNYAYNALGQLIEKSGNGGTTIFVYDEGAIGVAVRPQGGDRRVVLNRRLFPLRPPLDDHRVHGGIASLSSP
jgi:YD repeat-containing protein